MHFSEKKNHFIKWGFDEVDLLAFFLGRLVLVRKISLSIKASFYFFSLPKKKLAFFSRKNLSLKNHINQNHPDMNFFDYLTIYFIIS